MFLVSSLRLTSRAARLPLRRQLVANLHTFSRSQYFLNNVRISPSTRLRLFSTQQQQPDGTNTSNKGTTNDSNKDTDKKTASDNTDSANKDATNDTKDTNKDSNKDNTENAKEQPKEEEIPDENLSWRVKAGEYSRGREGRKGYRVGKNAAYFHWIVGGATLAFVLAKVVLFFYEAYNLPQGDPNLIVQYMMNQIFDSIKQHQSVINKFAKGPAVAEETMVQVQMYGNVTVITFPLLQPNTAARVGTVYVDLVQEKRAMKIAHAYVDFVWGSSLDIYGLMKEKEIDIGHPMFILSEELPTYV